MGSTTWDHRFSFACIGGKRRGGHRDLILTGVFIETRRRRRQSCFQFHLGELLALVTFVAIALSFYAIRRKEYIEECKVYEFLHRDENGPSADWSPNGPDWQLEGPDWLLPILGKDRYYELFAQLSCCRGVGRGPERSCETAPTAPLTTRAIFAGRHGSPRTDSHTRSHPTQVECSRGKC